MKTPIFSVLVVGYNSAMEVRRLLDSLRAQPSWNDCEILLGENGSSEIPAMEEIAEEFGARLLVLQNPGFGTACNSLAKLARGEIILLANPDLWFEGDILPVLYRNLREPGIGAVGPRLLDDDGTEQISWNLPMGLWWELLEAHGLQTWWRRRLMRRIRKQDPHGPWQVGIATAACLAIPRSLFLEIGGFDEGFFLNGEDLELCDRLRSRGLAVLVNPEIHAIHGNSSIQGKDLGRFVADRLEGKRKYLSRRYRGFSLLVARALWIEMVSIRLAAGWILLRGSNRTRLPGYRRILLRSLFLLIKAPSAKNRVAGREAGSTILPGNEPPSAGTSRKATV
jgi:GT2 family glycosyltransferase